MPLLFSPLCESLLTLRLCVNLFLPRHKTTLPQSNIVIPSVARNLLLLFLSSPCLFTSLIPYFSFSKSIPDSHFSADPICSSQVTSFPVYAAVRAIMHDTADSTPFAA